jgi:hypothetical protein
MSGVVPPYLTNVSTYTARIETVHVSKLPPFSNQRGCPRCGARWEIRVHFDRYRPRCVASASTACAGAVPSGSNARARARTCRR